MTPHDLIAAFDVLADAPDGVKRLRELVLSLAVRGKLVPQDPEDEPASAALGASGKPRSAMSGPHELPDSWEWARFTEVAEIASNLVDPAAFSDEPHVAPDSIEKGTGRLLGFRTIGEDGVRSGKHRFFPGQILYSKIRPNLSKVVVVDFAGLCSADMYPINPRIDRGYLHRFMLSWPFLMQVTADDNRLAMPKVNQAQLSSVLVATPPLGEQRRIVARVDELMGLLDRLEAARATRDAVRRAARDAALSDLRDAPDAEAVEAAWGRIARQMDDLFAEPQDVAPLRQAVLQLAVRGRLVEQDPADEPPDELLRQLGEAAGWPQADGQLEVGQPWKLPRSWRWVPFGMTHLNRDKERVPLSREERSTRPGPFDYYGASGVIDKIDDYLFDKPLLLIGEDGANLVLRSTPIAFIAHGKYWVNNHAHVLDSIDLESLRYLALFVNAIDLKPYLTGTAQPKLNQKKMNSIPCALPPLAEQRRIVAKVDDLMALCDDLEARLTATRDLHGQFAAAAVHHLDV